MSLVRHKQPIMEGRQVTVDNIKEVEKWCNGSIKGICLPRENQVIDIYSFEEVRAEIGDWIIRGPGMRFFVCKPEAFAENYELYNGS